MCRLFPQGPSRSPKVRWPKNHTFGRLRFLVRPADTHEVGVGSSLGSRDPSPAQQDSASQEVVSGEDSITSQGGMFLFLMGPRKRPKAMVEWL